MRWSVLLLFVSIGGHAAVPVSVSATSDTMQPQSDGVLTVTLNHQHDQPLNDLELHWTMPSSLEIMDIQTNPDAWCEGTTNRRCLFGHKAWPANTPWTVTMQVRPAGTGASEIPIAAYATAGIDDAEGRTTVTVVSESPNPEIEHAPDTAAEEPAPTAPVAEDQQKVDPPATAETAPVSTAVAAPDSHNQADEAWNQRMLDVLEMVKAAEAAVWTVEPHLSLKENLQQWCNRAGWTLVWSATDLDARIIAPASWEDSFTNAVAQLMQPFEIPRMVGDQRLALSWQIAEGNQVLLIEEVRK